MNSSDESPQLPTATEFEIPQRSGETLCVPDADQFEDVARRNASALAGSAARLMDLPLAEVRRRTRQWALTAAHRYTQSLRIPLSVSQDAGPLLITGHQPFLFHPGVWIKHLLVGRLAAQGIVGLSMAVDSDTFEEIGVDVPTMQDGLQMVRETLLKAAADVPYEAQQPPTEEEWRHFLDRVMVHLGRLGQAEVQTAFQEFVQAAGRVTEAGDLGTFMTVARRRYEGERPYLELPASRLAQSPEFRLFFLHILRDCVRFAEVYNRHLEAYRARNNIRTTAQPFPNLEVSADRVELPFWVLHRGRRQPCFAQILPDGWRLWAGEVSVGTIRGSSNSEVLADLAIRPRALTLTAFSRLCVADLFVHGVGGGRYDRATDEVLREYFEIDPPQYAVVTATLHLPLAAFNATGERQVLQRRLLELRHNPDRVLSAPSARERTLIDEKWQLIAALDGSALTRRERRQATQRIREINDLLARVLNEERISTEQRLANLGMVTQADMASTHRGYPFCFFRPQAVDALISALL